VSGYAGIENLKQQPLIKAAVFVAIWGMENYGYLCEIILILML
jgi:hypothetical protein